MYEKGREHGGEGLGYALNGVLDCGILGTLYYLGHMILSWAHYIISYVYLLMCPLHIA